MTSRTRILASDVLNQAQPCCRAALTDAMILALCPRCGPVPLSACRVTGGVETFYNCTCSEPLLVISAPNADKRPWPGRGYRLGDFVLRNPVALAFCGVRLRASPHALAGEPPAAAGDPS